jgi:hypothetical protein
MRKGGTKNRPAIRQASRSESLFDNHNRSGRRRSGSLQLRQQPSTFRMSPALTLVTYLDHVT